MKALRKTRRIGVAFVLVLLVLGLSLAGCGSKNSGSGSADSSKKEVTLVVGASPTPHAEILRQVVGDLKAQGIDLQIKEYTDYVQPNLAVQNGDIEANYFQHQPYLDDFNKQNNTDLVSVGAVHYEPFGLYPGKKKALAEVGNGAQVAVPNDTTNEARALLLLQDIGWVKLKDGAGINATKQDITENPHNLKIVEVEAAQLPRSVKDVDYAIINGNYAIEAGFSVEKDALATEKKDSLAATTYANIVAVKKGDENKPEILALMKALKSEKVKTFIEDTYKGAVVPAF
ncbi:MAG: MetQ/NlpA family ABC transporter substrate-binding protein [Coriobacteriia bacterium]|nr:MetQ/NlpA family ABC transporter substrate-binding protein [Coriobacteriia bacterium]